MKLPVYAVINLSTGACSRMEISSDYYHTYIGGKTLGARLLLDLTPAGVDPLGPEGGGHRQHQPHDRNRRAELQPL